MEWAAIIGGLILLVVGAELIVRYGARLAARLGIPPLIIGLTIVSVGTSAPELAIGIDAALAGEGSLAIGNIAGTNLVNLLLILGLSAVLLPLPLTMQTLRIDLPTMGAVAILLLAVCVDGVLSLFDGVLLIVVAVAYTVAIVRAARRENAEVVAEFAHEFTEPITTRRRSMLLPLLLLGVGIVIVIVGAEWLVTGAVDLAEAAGVSSVVIGLTIVAIGTSAPELVTAIVSTIRGDRDIAIGNLIGSSTFNLTFILGAAVLAAPIAVEPALILVDLPMMIAATLVIGVLMISGRALTRLEGGVMVAAYLAYLASVLIART
ncbi:calcium/sodium antiporter [Microbacterium sp.]|uniref:calcium/sodium antiporter n=1 Tax=Microbacterium sp. TaxID=51671 RepID=UPI00373669C4